MKMDNPYVVFEVLLNEKKNGREFNWKTITRDKLKELVWEKNLTNSQIGELYGVHKATISNRKTKWDLQLRNKAIDQLFNSKDPNVNKLLDQLAKQLQGDPLLQ